MPFSKIYRSACTMLFCLAAAGNSAHGAILSTSLSSSSVTAGQQFTLDVIVSGLDTGQALGGFDLDLVFNPALLSPDHVLFGDRLGVVDVDQFTSAVLSPGRTDFAAVSLASEVTLLGLQSGPFTLAQLVFDAVGPGTAAIDFDALTAPGLLLSDQFGNAIAVTASSGAEIRIAPSGSVPEPATILLFIPGLLTAAWRRGIRKTAG